MTTECPNCGNHRPEHKCVEIEVQESTVEQEQKQEYQYKKMLELIRKIAADQKQKPNIACKYFLKHHNLGE